MNNLLKMRLSYRDIHHCLQWREGILGMYRALPTPKGAIVYTRPFLEVGREKGKPPSFICDILIGISIWNSDNSFTKKSLFEYIEEEAIGKEMVCRVWSRCRCKHLDRKNGESRIEC